jgi:hypothetical protein
MSPTAFLQLLHDSELGTALRESLYMFPLVEGIHLVGLAFSFGLILFTDLRLIGWFLPQVPVSELLRRLRPWLIAGFAGTFITGILLTMAEGPRLLEIPVFPLKLGLIVLAGLNALWFEIKFGRNLSQWDQQALPFGAQIAGWTSLVSWSLVVICGRMIPYLATH